eukprot:TRINITY_DN16537_c0_g1_i1.p1 TRINITY_DN16537_c0_g1~~TRINITY_DN16537_c0_g1_i1.p1  ORF type:complete len:115 (+),score=30.37 TRINITY_DN16537_c0_g1_i1:153-497(+)
MKVPNINSSQMHKSCCNYFPSSASHKNLNEVPKESKNPTDAFNLNVAIPEDSDNSESSDSSEDNVNLLKTQPMSKQSIKESISYIKHLIKLKTRPSLKGKTLAKSKSTKPCTLS